MKLSVATVVLVSGVKRVLRGEAAVGAKREVTAVPPPSGQLHRLAVEPVAVDREDEVGVPLDNARAVGEAAVLIKEDAGASRKNNWTYSLTPT
jgi:hypothetical protein